MKKPIKQIKQEMIDSKITVGFNNMSDFGEHSAQELRQIHDKYVENPSYMVAVRQIVRTAFRHAERENNPTKKEALEDFARFTAAMFRVQKVHILEWKDKEGIDDEQ